MATEALKRLGGGRWETKDGRFTVEPQSGTWVLVDNDQTNEFGLPLVRGPFPTLTAAKDAIDGARSAGPATSPLAEQLKAAPKTDSRPADSAKGRSKAKETPKAPEPPPELKWLRDLGPPDAKRARTLITRLEAAGASDPEAVARAEVERDEPALARLAVERGLAAAAAADDARVAVAAVVDLLLDGRDEALGARWKLVDGDGREIRRLDLPKRGR